LVAKRGVACPKCQKYLKVNLTDYNLLCTNKECKDYNRKQKIGDK